MADTQDTTPDPQATNPAPGKDVATGATEPPTPPETPEEVVGKMDRKSQSAKATEAAQHPGETQLAELRKAQDAQAADDPALQTLDPYQVLERESKRAADAVKRIEKLGIGTDGNPVEPDAAGPDRATLQHRDMAFAYFPITDNTPAWQAPAGGSSTVPDGHGGTLTVSAGDFVTHSPTTRQNTTVAQATFKSQHNLP